MGKLPNEERRATGEKVNLLKAEVERGFEARLAELAKKKRDADLAAPPFDLTLPGRLPVPRGHKHPISRGARGRRRHLPSDGLRRARRTGDRVRDEQLRAPRLPAGSRRRPTCRIPSGPRTPVGGRTLLRTHTSNIQVRAMMGQKPPMAFIAPGAGLPSRRRT